MTRTINTTRSQAVENATPLSGSEAIEVNAAEELSQQITASTEEEVTLGDFKAPQLKAMSLLADQIVNAQFLGTRHAILATAAAAPDTITHTGDLEQEIFAGDIVRLEGTVADDGEYEVASVVEGAGTTTITLTDGHALPAGGGGAVGTVARVASFQPLSYGYTVATVTLATGVITYTGDISDIFAVGDILRITGSTGNDGIWSVTAVTTDGPPVTTTTITVEDVNDGGLLLDNTNDGEISLARTAFNLAANVPFQWTYESGTKNPFIHPELSGAVPPTFNAFRGEVTVCMVDNQATSAANFQAILSKNSIL